MTKVVRTITIDGLQRALSGADSFVLTVCFIGVSLAFFYAAISISNQTHLWMDEVLAVLIAREHSIRSLIGAIWHGSDFSPPTYHILLHEIEQVFGAGNDRLIWRIPSIVAVFGTGLCVHAILRSKLDPFVAMAAFALVVDSSLFGFAVQARPYALLSFGLAAALLIWSEIDPARSARLRAGSIWLIASLCMLLHFYGLVVAAVVGTAEFIWEIRHRRIRPSVWTALVLTIPIELLLMPLILHLGHMSDVDTRARGFYGRPTPAGFVHALFDVLAGGSHGFYIICAALGVSWMARRIFMPETPLERVTCERSRIGSFNLQAILIALAAFPLIMFTLASLLTKSFVTRYVVAAGFFPAMALACWLDTTESRRFVALVIIVLSATGLVVRAHVRDSFDSVLAMVEAVEPHLPVVVGEGQLYIEMMEASKPGFQNRMIFLRRPANSESPDPTNENEVARLAEIHPTYRISSLESFIEENSKYYLLSRGGITPDTVTPALESRGLIGPAVVRAPGATLYLAHNSLFPRP